MGYSIDKYSCIEEFYHVHMFFNWVIFLSGIICMVTRLIPATSKYNLHAWFGRIYILSMLWSTSASLLINNDGWFINRLDRHCHLQTKHQQPSNDDRTEESH